jgi:hypothetical protein
MRNFWWVALVMSAVVVTIRPASADEPTRTPATIPAPPAGAVTTQQLPPLPTISEAECARSRTAAEFLRRRVTRCPTCGGPLGAGDCGCCAECGKRQSKFARFLDWLIYVPLDKGKTKCCPVCRSAPPPAWAFFPCEGGGRCASCAVAAPTLYYTKASTPAPANQTVETAYPPSAGPKVQAPPPAPTPPSPPPSTRVSMFKQQGVANAMPVLDPSQFRKPVNGGN